MKKILAIVFVAALILSLAACGSSAKKEKPVETLTVAHKGDPTSLCHLTVTFGSANGPVDCFLYDRLLDYNAEKNDVEPMLATKWEYIDDTHIKFTLREDVVAHDGSPFTASDVIYTLKTGQDSGKLANYYGNFDLDGCEVIDKYTVIIATKKVDPFVLYNLSNIPLGMVVEAAVTNSGDITVQDQKPDAGTGPYKLVEWVAGSTIKFARNEKYWGEKPYYDFVEIRIITDASSRVMNLESGTVDVALDPATAQVVLLEDNKDFQIINYPTTNLTTLYFNCTKEPFNDVKVRQAIALALDYESNLEVAASGYGSTSDSFLPKNSSAYVAPDGSYVNYFHYDVEAAKAKLAESSYPNGFSFELLYMEGATFQAYAELIQNQLGAIGITVTPVPTASTAFYELLSAGNYEAEIVNSSNPDPSIQLKYFDHRVGFADVRGGTGWQGPAELDTLIDQANSVLDTETRKTIYAQISAIINENCPAIPLYSPTKVCLADADISGIRLTEFNDIDLSKAYRVS
ncbi:MAG: ABC transporter substrate-binding protein [Clostridiales bacterium]|nr:ABC transporter substrate-binding protein [Clostridiales bacterium]